MTTLFALLVGLNDYEPSSRVRALRGCLNDTLKVETFLLENLGVPRENVRVLRNEEATRDGILATFRSHLIENSAIQQDDQILFHYSGHGSRVRDFQGVEPDGYHESLVAYDSRTVGKTDVIDKEVGALLEELANAKGSNITVILDSCHSGSGTRDLPDDEGTPLNREIDPDERPLPAEVADFVRRYTGGSRSVTPSVSGWTPADMPYVLLAGCRDEELSREYEGTPGVWNGAMTYFTLEYLKRMPSNATYRDLHETVAAQVNGLYKTQSPQCEGDRDRVVFGGVTVERYPFINVVKVEGDTITLDGGIVHDLRAGTQLALYAPEIRTRDETKTQSPLVTVEVTRADVTTAEAKIVTTPGEVHALNASEIPARARGVVISQSFDLRRQKVALLHDDDPASAAATLILEETIKGDGDMVKPSLYLEVVKSDEAPAYYVKAKAGNYEVYDGNGDLLLTPVDFAQKHDQPSDEIGATRIRQGLEALVRWQTVLALKNEVSADLEKQVTLRLRHVKPGSGRTEAEEPITPNNDGSVSLFYDPDNKEANTYALEIENGSSETLFANVFLMTHDYGIYHMYPTKGQRDSITGTLTVGLKQSKAPSVTIFLEPHETTTTEYLKVILTTEPTELGLLAQEALEVPKPRTEADRGGSLLAQLIDASVNGGERGAGLLDDDDDNAIKPWAGITLPFHVVRKSDSTDLPLEAGRVVLDGDTQGMWVEKPAGFTGKISITTVGQEVRALSDVPTTPLPPALAKSPDQFQLLERPGTRDAEGAGLVLEIETDERAHQIISDQNPLRLNVGNLNDKNVEVVPIYYDGQDFVLAGYDTGKTLNLITLPPPSGEGMDEVTARGLGRTIKLFLFKKIGRKQDDIGLRRFTISDTGKVNYEAVDHTLFKSGDKVAVFVHGFSSDTEAMVRDPVRQLNDIGMPYDHYLAFDYETFGTPIDRNGETLATALKQEARFKAGDGITVHVYAHSMGGVVTRSMVDLHGGDEFVDAVIIAGSPANGTPLASTVEGGVYLLSSLLNQSNIPFVGNVAGFLDAFREQGPGLKDLEVDSDLARKLNALQNPSNVPYLLLAGENNPVVENRAKRLANKVKDGFLDTFFGEQNDSVIGVSSVHGVRLGHYPPGSEKATLPCDHFHYFAIPETQKLLKQWLSNKG